REGFDPIHVDIETDKHTSKDSATYEMGSTLMPKLWGWNSKLGNKNSNFGKTELYHDPKYQIK
ncbi:MAG: hypothetical protein VX014_00500, partial [Verrucomicrobiota bacterium]|nr:hypothetical protein [Verrucomicrobiota bacterium]